MLRRAAGLNTMQELVDSEAIEVDCLVGRLCSVSQSLVRPLAEAALERMSLGRVFRGADAVTAEDGLRSRTRPNPAQGTHSPRRPG